MRFLLVCLFVALLVIVPTAQAQGEIEISTSIAERVETFLEAVAASVVGVWQAGPMIEPDGEAEGISAGFDPNGASGGPFIDPLGLSGPFIDPLGQPNEVGPVSDPLGFSGPFIDPLGDD